MKTNIPYKYIVTNIGSAKEPAYKAFVPAINCIVFGGDAKELEDGIRESIDIEIKELKRQKLPIPKPEYSEQKSGKLVLRIRPELHARLSLEAMTYGKSLNSYIVEKVAA